MGPTIGDVTSTSLETESIRNRRVCRTSGYPRSRGATSRTAGREQAQLLVPADAGLHQ